LTHTKTLEKWKKFQLWWGLWWVSPHSKVKDIHIYSQLDHNVDIIIFASGSKLRVFPDYLIVGKWEEEEEEVVR
jgi:hypothetical protein